MIEVTDIKEQKTPEEKKEFKDGVYIGDKEMMQESIKEIEQEEVEKAMRGIAPDKTIVSDLINEDLKDLKAYEKSHCGCHDNGACTTAIGHPYPLTPVTIKTGQRQRVFDSGLKVLDMHTQKIQIDIPREILNACDELQAHVGHNEFSIVCKGAWDDDGRYLIGSEYKVPKQKVEGAAVDYDLVHLEQLKLEGFNTVIHSHPFKSDTFSSSDSETINSHFECSVLYSLRDFTAATIAISPVSGMKLIARGEPCIEGQNTIPKSELDNIEKKNYQNQYNNDYRWYGDGANFRNSGRQGNLNNDRRGCSCGGVRSRSAMSTREDVLEVRGRDIYTYDCKSDTFRKNGQIVDSEYERRRGRAYLEPMSHRPVHVVGTDVHVRQVPAGTLPRDVFSVQQTRVFDSGKPDEISVAQVGGRKKGGKKNQRENLPKIDLMP